MTIILAVDVWFDDQRAAAREQPVETVDFAVADRLRQAGHQLTRDELTARRALDDYIAEFHEWSRQAATAAFEELKKSQKAVRRKLVRAGYHDADPFDPDPSKILPGWIAAHPAVAAARQRHEELRSRSVDFSARQENRRHVADLERTLGRVVEAAFA
jgi:hypothetical protein